MYQRHGGRIDPNTGYELVRRIKDAVDVPLEIHTHATSGISEMTYLKTAEAGADIIDTAISSFAGGTSQPTTESIAMALEDMGFDTGLDLQKQKKSQNISILSEIDLEKKDN